VLFSAVHILSCLKNLGLCRFYIPGSSVSLVFSLGVSFILVGYVMCSATCLQGLRSPVPARALQFSQYLLGLSLILPHCRFISATCLVLWAGISVYSLLFVSLYNYI